MFGRKSAGPRPIADLGMDRGEGWYDIEFDNPNWADQLSRAIATSPQERESLRKDLSSTQESFANVAATGAGLWVLIRPDAPGRSICTMSYGVVPVGDATPDQYEQLLASDDGRREPGVRFDVVRTWQVRIDAGVAVGAYNLIGHSSLNYDGVASENRTLFCVFPDGSTDAVELSFSTLEPDRFDDFVAQTMSWVSTLEVVLEK